MSFTSFDVHIDETVLATCCGIYTFRAQGSIYHKIGGFHPNVSSRFEKDLMPSSNQMFGFN